MTIPNYSTSPQPERSPPNWRTSLEHELAYKLDKTQQESVSTELQSCAAEISDIDGRMQRLYNVSKTEQNQPGYLQERSREQHE